MKKNYSFIHKLLVTLCLIPIFGSINAQNGQHRVTFGMDMKVSGKLLSNPFTGGFNAPLFCEFDVNMDGKLDIVIFDRSDAKVSVYLRNKNNNGLTYAPKYENVFPKNQNNKLYFNIQDINATGKPSFISDGLYGSLILYRNKTKTGDTFPTWDTSFFIQSRNRNPEGHFLMYNDIDFVGLDLPSWADNDGDGDLDFIVYDNFYRQFNRHMNCCNNDTFMLTEFGFGIFRESLAGNEVTLGTCFHREILGPRLCHNGGATSLLFDNDEDGDLDMLIANVGFKNLIYLKNGRKEFNYFTDTMIFWDSMFPRNAVRGADFELPAPYYVDLDGDNVKDLILSPYSLSNTKEVDNIWFYKNKGKNNKPDFELQKKNYLADETIDLGGYTAPAFCDIDNDGDQDLIVASNGDQYETKGQKDRLNLFRNTGTKDKPEFDLENTDWLSLTTRKLRATIPHFMDADGDGDKDLLIGENRGLISFYKNTAATGQPAIYTLVDTNILAQTPNAFNTDAAPTAYDYNGDNLMDLLVGRVDGRVELYINQSTSSYVKFTLVNNRAWGLKGNAWVTSETGDYFENVGYSAPFAVDLNRSGKKQILLGTLFGGIRMYEPGTSPVTDSLKSNPNWVLQYNAKGDSIVPDFGGRVVPAAADLNGDSIPEILVGTLRGGLHLISNPYAKKLSSTKQLKPVIQFSLFPNPAGKTVNILTDANNTEMDLKVFSSTGALMLSDKINAGENFKTLDIAAFSSGIYLVQISGNGLTGTSKLIVGNP